MILAVFEQGRQIARGTVAEVAAAMQSAASRGGAPLSLDASTGQVVDLDLRGTASDVATRHAQVPRRGRPKLGVKAREVTLLPRHWDWLANQRGGASAALRRLVEAAIRESGAADDPHKAQDAAYHAAQALAGDLPGYEASLRALYAGNLDGMEEEAAAWPADIRTFVLSLARGGPE